MNDDTPQAEHNSWTVDKLAASVGPPVGPLPRGRHYGVCRRPPPRCPRAVPCPPELTELLRAHLRDFPPGTDGPLAAKPYDLRHACVSMWLNGGVAAPQVAEWAGHSVEVLLKVYAKCLDGQEEAARRRVEAALGDVNP